MSSKPKIMSVDDDPRLQQVIQIILEQDFDVHCVDSGPACLSQVASLSPELILMDVTMPGMDGYEVCSSLKSDQATKNIPVIFVSVCDTLDERMKGYEAGGQDYITKPFDEEELLVKVKLMLKNKSEAQHLQVRVKDATDTAMVALKFNGELGVVIDFLRKCSTCKTYEELGEKLIAATSAFGLQCSTQIRHQHNTVNLSSTGWCPPLEAQLLAMGLGKGRIVDIKNRTFVNYEHVSLLVKNMPVDDKEKYGQLKDHLAVLVEGANAKGQVLINESDAYEQQQKNALVTAREAAHEINNKFKNYCEESSRIINNLAGELEKGMFYLGLTEEQEKYFLTLGEKSKDELSELFANGLEIDGEISKLLQVFQ